MNTSSWALIVVACVSLVGTLYSATAARKAQQQANTVSIDARVLEYLDREVREAQDSIARMRQAVRAAEDETDRERERRRSIQREVEVLTDAVHRMARAMQLTNAPLPAEVAALLNFPSQPGE